MAHQTVTLEVPGGGARPAALALPEGDGKGPAVVVVHDVFGLTPDTHRHLERFAKSGYVAIAPDLYDGGRVRCVVETVLGMARDGRGALPAIEAAREMLARHPRVDSRRIAVTGFCMGGGFALLAAADGAYAVAAPFYGAVPRSKERLRNVCPTLAQYGERDAPFRSHAARLARHLESLGVEHEVVTYPDVGHSFMNDHKFALARLGPHGPLRAKYDAPTEAIAWDRLLAFFDQHMPVGH